jgi:hypothetical protein
MATRPGHAWRVPERQGGVDWGRKGTREPLGGRI